MHRAHRLVPLVLAGALLLVPLARASSPDVVVSQVFAGGGNSGASYTNDFVELFNRGSAAVDLGGWTVQYASAGSTSWQATPLAGSLAPGHYYLVQLGSTAAVGAPLPSPDATGTSNLAASGGKVALVHDTAALTCGATAGSCSATSAVVDLLGYGSAGDYEGAGAAGLSSTTAALRAGAGCVDTDSNSADFTATAPSPRNSSSPATSCGASPPPQATGPSQDAAVNVVIQPVLSIALDRSTLAFGQASAGDTPPALSERVTVVSNDSSGYALTVHRSAFAPADLPLGIAASAPAGGQLGAALAGGGLAALPVTPAADLLLGTTAAPSAGAGDSWAASLGFVSPLPFVPSGQFIATVTFTAIGR